MVAMLCTTSVSELGDVFVFEKEAFFDVQSCLWSRSRLYTTKGDVLATRNRPWEKTVLDQGIL